MAPRRGCALPSAAVSVPAALAARCGTGRPPVVGRTEDGRCLLDLRTVSPYDDDLLVSVVLAASATGAVAAMGAEALSARPVD